MYFVTAINYLGIEILKRLPDGTYFVLWDSAIPDKDEDGKYRPLCRPKNTERPDDVSETICIQLCVLVP